MQEAGNWKPYNSRALVHNIDLVFRSGDITKLNKPTYEFVANLSGFIAHYNLFGFQDNYEDLREFGKDLLSATEEGDCQREETDRDFIKWYGQAYCTSKAQAMRGMREAVQKYQEQVSVNTGNKDKEKIENLQALVTEVIRRNDVELTTLLVKKLGL